MKRIAVFRYHKDADICINRLELFKSFNPEVEVHGIYGGSEDEFDHYTTTLGQYLTSNYCLKGVPSEWKWKNFDFILQKWYADAGKEIEFDYLHLLEWDFIMFDSLENLYRDIPENGVGLTGLIPLEKIENQWYWTVNPERRKEWKRLMKSVEENFDYHHKPYGALCPGLSLPKNCLEKMERIRLPELLNDEVRLPLYAQISEYELYDTGFYRK